MSSVRPQQPMMRLIYGIFMGAVLAGCVSTPNGFGDTVFEVDPSSGPSTSGRPAGPSVQNLPPTSETGEPADTGAPTDTGADTGESAETRDTAGEEREAASGSSCP